MTNKIANFPQSGAPICPICGRPCRALGRLLRTVRDADRVARPLTPELDVSGQARLADCETGCMAAFRMSPQGVDVRPHALV